jgi:hypothetical protein
MTEDVSLENAIAIRHLSLDDQPTLDIQVILGRPQREFNAAGYDSVLCPYQIRGIGNEKVRFASGIDDFQALQLAMEIIGSELYFKLNPRYGGTLNWEGGKDGDLGFPVPRSLEEEVEKLRHHRD